MIVQIILDFIMIIVLFIGIVTGKHEEISTWVALMWVFIALFAHLQLKEHDTHRD
jgi:hypothetical protein